MKLMRMIRQWFGKAEASAPETPAQSLTCEGTTPPVARVAQKEIMTPIVPGDFFPRLCLRREPKYTFLAVPRGTLRGQPGTVSFPYSQRITCGTTLRASDGRRFVVLQRKTITINAASSEVRAAA